MSEPDRTPEEERVMIASIYVAFSPDPFPHRSPAARAAISAAWDDRERLDTIDRVALAKAMRAMDPEDRAYVVLLLGVA